MLAIVKWRLLENLGIDRGTSRMLNGRDMSRNVGSGENGDFGEISPRLLTK